MGYFFSADHHFFHKNIIRFCKRPFDSLEEMHYELIKRHNEVVSSDDTTFVAGDFALTKSMRKAYEIINQLNGKIVLLRGSHDYFMSKGNGPHYFKDLKNIVIEGTYITICHYCLRVWPRSHYNSWHLYGHSHGKLEPIGKSLDIGVDTHNFYPYSWDEVKQRLENAPDNFNFLQFTPARGAD